MHLKFTQGFCLCLLFVCTSLSKSFSQDGTIDPAFGENGKIWNPQAGFVVNGGGTITPRILVTSDQKILHLSNTSSGLLMVRYLPNGNIDASFGSGGMKTIPSAVVIDAILLPDQTFLVLGNAFSVRRFTANGDPDPTFDSDGMATSPAGTTTGGFAVQADGKIVVVGSGSMSGENVFTTVRFNANGSIDNSFDGDGVAQFNFNAGFESASAVAVQTDGKIVVAGSVTNFIGVDNGQPIFRNLTDVGLIRYLPDGTLDMSFGVNGKVNFITAQLLDEITRVLIQPDGKIIVAGKQSYYSDPDATYFFADRFLSNGALDTGFNSGTVSIRTTGGNLIATDAALQADGKLLIAGYTYCSGLCPFEGLQDFTVLRLLDNGTADGSFKGGTVAYIPVINGGVGTTASVEWGNSLASQGNQLLLGGFASVTNQGGYRALLIRLNNSSPIISRNPVSFYRDQDGDGYGTSESEVAYMQPGGYASKNGDCNDNDNTIYPGAPEVQDGKDNNCDGKADDAYTKLPAIIEAENWSAMSGVQTETTSDEGGGLNVGYIDNGDWMDYNITAPFPGKYTLFLRLATPSTSQPQLQVKLGDKILATVDVPNTGGFQTWTTVAVPVELERGQQTLRLLCTGYGYWNINWLRFFFGFNSIPFKVEAENYTSGMGVQNEPTQDVGGGLNLGYIDNGDWIEYAVVAPYEGEFLLNLRLATPSTSYPHLDVRWGEETTSNFETVLASIDVPNTGGFQNWQTVPVMIHLQQGYQVVRLLNTGYGYWNINWLEFLEPSSAPHVVLKQENKTGNISGLSKAFNIYPNPINQNFVLELNNSNQGKVKVDVLNMAGKVEKTFYVNKTTELSKHNLSLYGLAGGQYILQVQMNGYRETKKILKL